MSNSETPFLSVLRVWAAMAWADGRIVPAEATAMKEFICLAPISEEEQKIALGWLKKRVELDTAEFEGMRPDARANLYRSVARIAAIDKDVAEAERDLLKALRAPLGIADELAESIESEIFEAHISTDESA